MARTVGSTNKNKDRLWKALKAEYGEDFDPILRMAAIASNDDNDDTLKLNAWKEIAQYVYPKLKAVEHSGSIVDKPYEEMTNGELTSELHRVREIIRRSPEETTGEGEPTSVH